MHVLRASALHVLAFVAPYACTRLSNLKKLLSHYLERLKYYMYISPPPPPPPTFQLLPRHPQSRCRPKDRLTAKQKYRRMSMDVSASFGMGCNHLYFYLFLFLSFENEFASLAHYIYVPSLYFV